MINKQVVCCLCRLHLVRMRMVAIAYISQNLARCRFSRGAAHRRATARAPPSLPADRSCTILASPPSQPPLHPRRRRREVEHGVKHISEGAQGGERRMRQLGHAPALNRSHGRLPLASFMGLRQILCCLPGVEHRAGP